MSKRTKTHREAPEMGAMLARLLRAMARRAGEGDLEALAELRQLQDVLADAIGAAGRAAHDDAGFSFGEIAAALGITRQAARQRFGSPTVAAIEQLAEDFDAAVRNPLRGRGRDK